MSDISARKLSAISVDPDAKSKKLDATLEKLSSIRAEKLDMDKVEMPSIRAKRVEEGQIVINSNAPKIEAKASASSSLGLKGLRVTSSPEEKPSATKTENYKASATVSKTIEKSSSVETAKPMKAQMNPQIELDARQKRMQEERRAAVQARTQAHSPLQPHAVADDVESTKFSMPTFIGMAITALWLLVSAIYVQSNMGFVGLFTQQPHILGGFMAGIMAPVAFLWMILGYFQRGAEMRDYAEIMRGEMRGDSAPQAVTHMRQLPIKTPDVSGLSEKLESQMDDLMSDMTAKMSSRCQRLLDAADEIEKRTSDLRVMNFSSVTQDPLMKEAPKNEALTAKANEIEGRLNSHMGKMDKMLQDMDDKMKSIESVGDGTANKLSAAMVSTVSGVDEIGSAVRKAIESLNKATIEAKIQAEGILQNAEDKIVNINNTCELTVDNVENRLNERSSNLSKILQDMEGKIKSIEDVGDDTANKLSEAMVSAISGADNIGSAVRRAIEGLSKATIESKIQAEGLLSDAEDKILGLNSASEKTADNIESVLSLMDESRSKMEKSSEVVGSQVDKLTVAVQSQTSQIFKAQDSLNECIEAIQSQMDKPLKAMSLAVDKVSAKHTEIEETLSKRVGELNLASDKALENGNTIRDVLRLQAQDMSTLVGQIAGHSRSVQSMLVGQKDELSRDIDFVLNKIETVGQSLQGQSDKLSVVATHAEENIVKLKDVLTERCEGVADDTDKVVVKLTQLDGLIDKKLSALILQTNDANSSINNMTANIVKSADIIEPITTKATGQIEQTAQRFGKMTEGFASTTASNLDKLKTMGILFDERLQTLSASAQDASKILDMSGDKLNLRVDSIETATKVASQRILDMDKLFKNKASEINLNADQALLKIGSVQKALNDQFHDLSATVGESVAQIEDVGAQYQKRSKQIKIISEEAIANFDHAGSSADSQAQHLKKVAQETAAKMQEMVIKVQAEAKELLNSSSKTFVEMKTTGDSLANRAKEVEAQMQKSLKVTRKYGDEMGQQADKIADFSHISAERLSKAVGQLAAKMLDVNKAADDVALKIEGSRDKLSEETEHLADVSIKASRVVEESAASYLRQSHSLFKATQDASAQAEKIRESDLRIQRESFMSSAKFVLESLHSLSVDLTRMMEGDIKEKIWKAYQKGDISAFTKRLLEVKDKLPMAKIKDKYENDNEFRTYLNRFTRQFEEVYEQAYENDHGELLTATFASSDIGGLYVLLCDVAGKKSVIGR